MTNKNRNIKIFDTTLRDGEQSPGASMSLREKIQIAEIVNSNLTTIDDRYDIYDKIYYYQLEVINQFGLSSYSNIMQGSTLP